VRVGWRHRFGGSAVSGLLPIARTDIPNEWRETVRDIFDMLVLSRVDLTPLENRILERIQSRHHSYFCEGKTMEEWAREDSPS
jgi:hypothetical protein